MKRLPTYLATTVLALVLLTYLCTFQVRSTEVAILKTFGKPAAEAITSPGLQWKWMWPIESVVKYDNRKRVLEDKTEETSTRDGKNVILTSYTIWRISDPGKFHENFQVEERGIKDLRSTIQTFKNAEVGQRDFSEFVAVSQGPAAPADPQAPPADPAADSPIRGIERAILTRLQAIDQDYGVEVLEFGIKKLGLPQSVTSSIFNSMKTAQEGKAAIYTTEGEAIAKDIRGKADAARSRIIAAVQLKVSAIEAEGQSRVSGYYAQFDEHPELRIFLDNLKAIKKALATRATLIFDTEGLPFGMFLLEGRQAVLHGEVEPKLPAPRDALGAEATRPSEERYGFTGRQAGDDASAATSQAAEGDNSPRG